MVAGSGIVETVAGMPSAAVFSIGLAGVIFSMFMALEVWRWWKDRR